MMLKLEQTLTKHLKTLYPDVIDVELVVNDDPLFGYFSTNCAFKLAQKYSGTAMDYAKLLSSTMPSLEYVAKVEAIPPGYINFHTRAGFEGAFLEKLIALKSFQVLNIEQRLLKSPGDWRKYYFKQCLKHIQDFYQIKEVNNISKFKIGRVALKLTTQELQSNEYCFASLMIAPHQELVDLQTETFDSIFYAYRRTNQVLSYLNSLDWPLQDLELTGFKLKSAQSVFMSLLSFEYQLKRVLKYNSPDILAIFLKNLATRMHCLYNEITLWSGELSQDLFNRYLLQACQRVLMLSFTLLGIKGL